MKKNIYLIVSTLLFTYLFYEQEPGINVSIIASVVFTCLLLDTHSKRRNKVFLLLSISTIMCIISFAWYGDFISFVALFFVVLVTGYKAYYPKLSLASFLFSLAFNYGTFLFRVPQVKHWLNIKLGKKNFYKKLVNYFVIPILLISIFAFFYNLASDSFASFLHIDWKLNFIEIILLTCFGFFLMFTFFYFSVPKLLIKYNNDLTDDFKPDFHIKNKEILSSSDMSFTRRGGEISLCLLNILILFFIIVYCREQFSSNTKSTNLSSDVHARVYIIIASIAMAIVVIMGYFKGVLNFDKRVSFLKILSYIWIGLNAFLILISIAKNMEYVSAFGLTFKRIGVFIFLALSIIGLLITYYKITFVKTNFYLVNRMVWVLFITLLVTSTINWSWIVTKYNLTSFKDPDWDYLYSLNYNKKILYDLDKDRFIKKDYPMESVRTQKNTHFLSSHLYYRFLNISK